MKKLFKALTAIVLVFALLSLSGCFLSPAIIDTFLGDDDDNSSGGGYSNSDYSGGNSGNGGNGGNSGNLVQSLTVPYARIAMVEGASFQFDATYEPSDSTINSIEYSTSCNNITVDSYGIITAETLTETDAIIWANVDGIVAGYYITVVTKYCTPDFLESLITKYNYDCVVYQNGDYVEASNAQSITFNRDK